MAKKSKGAAGASPDKLSQIGEQIDGVRKYMTNCPSLPRPVRKALFAIDGIIKGEPVPQEPESTTNPPSTEQK